MASWIRKALDIINLPTNFRRSQNLSVGHQLWCLKLLDVQNTDTRRIVMQIDIRYYSHIRKYDNDGRSLLCVFCFCCFNSWVVLCVSCRYDESSHFLPNFTICSHDVMFHQPPLSLVRWRVERIHMYNPATCYTCVYQFIV